MRSTLGHNKPEYKSPLEWGTQFWPFSEFGEYNVEKDYCSTSYYRLGGVAGRRGEIVRLRAISVTRETSPAPKIRWGDIRFSFLVLPRFLCAGVNSFFDRVLSLPRLVAR